MLCRTALSMPGNAPRMLINADVMGADIIIFDLEDAVSLTQKDAARDMLRNYLMSGMFTGTCFVRVNGIATPWFEDDMRAVAPLNIAGVMLPKTETAQDVLTCDALLTEIEKEQNLPLGSRKIYLLCETALGVANVDQYINVSDRVELLSVGGEDYAVSLGVKRSKGNEELDYARRRLVVYCKAYGRKITDIVFTDTEDLQGLEEECRFGKQLGMDGKFIISPRHVETVNRIFAPTQQEIDHARRVIAAMEDAEKRGLGAVSLDGKMLDKPVLDQAKKVLAFVEQVQGGNV